MIQYSRQEDFIIETCADHEAVLFVKVLTSANLFRVEWVRVNQMGIGWRSFRWEGQKDRVGRTFCGEQPWNFKAHIPHCSFRVGLKFQGESLTAEHQATL